MRYDWRLRPPTLNDNDIAPIELQRYINYIVSRYCTVLESYTRSNGLPPWVQSGGLDSFHETELIPGTNNLRAAFPLQRSSPSISNALKESECPLLELKDEIDRAANVGLEIGTAKRDEERLSDWDRLRPIISALYVQQDMKLKDVQKICRDRYAFRALEQMFKKRLAVWGVRKNYTHEQKREALTFLKGNLKTGRSKFTVNQRPLKVARLRRAVQENGKLVRLEAAQPLAKSAWWSEQQITDGAPDTGLLCSTSANRLYLCGPTSIMQHHNYQAKSPSYMVPEILYISNSELYLTLVNQYYDWYCGQTEWDSEYYDYGSAMASVFESFRSGRSQLPSDAAWSFQLFNWSCNSIEGLIRNQPYQLLTQLMVEVFQPGWDEFNQVRSAILKFISCMAHRLYGSHYPLAKALNLLQDEEVLAYVAPIAVGLASIAVEKHFGPDRNEMWQIKVATTTAMLEVFDNSAAEIQCMSTIRQAHQMGLEGPSWALAKLAWIRWRQGRLEEAELLCLEVLWGHAKTTGTPIPRSSGIDACQILADMCFDRWDDEGAEIWSTLCMYGARKWPDNPAFLRYVWRVVHMLEIQGKQAEIESLRRFLRENPPVWEVVVEEEDHTARYFRSCQEK